MKIEWVHVCVTGSPCSTVDKKCIGEITIKKKKKKKKPTINKVKRLLRNQEGVFATYITVKGSDTLITYKIQSLFQKRLVQYFKVNQLIW